MGRRWGTGEQLEIGRKDLEVEEGRMGRKVEQEDWGNEGRRGGSKRKSGGEVGRMKKGEEKKKERVERMKGGKEETGERVGENWG